MLARVKVIEDHDVEVHGHVLVVQSTDRKGMPDYT